MKNFIIILIAVLLMPLSSWAATSIPFTITTSEAVNVTGFPRIQMDVGGMTRYATYTSGTGTSSLTFTYTMVAGDVDLDGVTLTSPMQLNGGTIKDLNGNDATLTFTVPNTANVKVNYPSLGMDFVADADGRYTLNGTAYNDLTSFLSAAGGTFTRASIGTYYDSAGALQTAASGTPRFDYDPVTHAAKGILIEESRTNLLLRSSEFDNAPWTIYNSLITTNTVTGPDGTVSAEKLTADTSTSNHSLYRNISATGTPYTLSAYAKQSESRWVKLQYYTLYANFDLLTGTKASTNATTSTIQSVGNGWYRCTMTFTTATPSNAEIKIASGDTPSVNDIFLGDGTSGLYIWGAQLEAGEFPTSYIPTTTATVTRQADNLNYSTTGWFNGTTGTWYAYFDGGKESTQGIYARVISYDGASSAIGTDCGTTSTVGSWNGGANICKTTGADYYTTAGGAAIAYNETLLTRSLTGRGLTPATGSYTGTYNSVGHIIRLGSDAVSSTHMLNGHMQKMKYYPSAVTDTQLQLMTQ